MANPDVRLASILLASGTVVSRILGFLRAILLAAAIGLVGSAGANMFGIANQLPNTIYAIVAGGVLSAIFVPQIVRASVSADGGAGYINKLLTACITVLAITTLLAVCLTPALITLYGTKLDNESRQLAIAFGYWCMPQVFFYGLYTVFGEVLNARKVFGPFTWAPVINNVIAIAGLGVFMVMFGPYPMNGWGASEWTPVMIAILGGTTTLGVVAQGLILLLFFRRAELRFRWDWNWRGVGLGTAGKLAGWTFGMLLLTTVAGIVETNVAGIASNSNDASIAALNNAWLVFMLPHSVIAVSIATAYFTRMSEHASRGDLAQVRSDLSSAARGIGMLIALASIIIVVCSPFIGAVFMPGNRVGIAAFGAIVVAYVIGLLPFSLLFLVQRAFYTLGDTKTPFFYTLLQVVLICAGSIVISQLPAAFIAIAIALLVTGAGIAQLLVAAVLLRRRLGGLEAKAVSVSFIRYALAAIPAVLVGLTLTVAVAAASPTSASLGTESRIGAIVAMAIIATGMSATYLLSLWALRAPELRQFVADIRSRGRR
ncbi:MAG: murein biosynthesis integral membrane protein MurJ [Agromyces sp.]